MNKIIQRILYVILLFALLAEGMVLLYCRKAENEREEARTKMIVKLQEKPQEPMSMEPVYRVMVKELPVYGQAEVSQNVSAEPMTILYRGDIIQLLEEGEGYVKIQLPDHTEGYAWFDCIEKNVEEEFAKRSEKVVVIDAGHQAKQNSEKEPLGPGETEAKAKVASGTTGTVTKVPEHELDLAVSCLVEKKLEEQGYTAVMIRRSADVNISNRERAMVANQLKADAFIRIHADGSEDSDAKGAMTIISTAGSPYEVVNYYAKSKMLAENVLESYTNETGIQRNRIMESDAYSGINWCTVPVTILEMGYMSNPEEDEKMQQPAMQEKMAEGIVQGVIRYLEQPYVE